MACKRGKATPGANTKLRLFADSGGFCQNPSCNRNLFEDTGSTVIHVAEIAHIFAAIDGGPRTNQDLSDTERGAYGNLILLCSNCHTTVDKASADYPDDLIKKWKRDHQLRLEYLFGALVVSSRAEVRKLIELLLSENLFIFQTYGPDLPYRDNPEAELAAAWRLKIQSRIIPNDRKILALLDANRSLATASELQVLEHFRQHTFDLEARHLTSEAVACQLRFPPRMAEMMES